MDQLNDDHRRHLLSRCQHTDKLLTEIEAILGGSDSNSPFPNYRSDFTPEQERIIRAGIARIREQLVSLLAAQGIALPPPRFSALHAVRVNFEFARLAIAAMEPHRLRGYGKVPDDDTVQLQEATAGLDRLIRNLVHCLSPETDTVNTEGMTTDPAGDPTPSSD